jgi:hypothetical protein
MFAVPSSRSPPVPSPPPAASSPSPLVPLLLLLLPRLRKGFVGALRGLVNQRSTPKTAPPLCSLLLYLQLPPPWLTTIPPAPLSLFNPCIWS